MHVITPASAIWVNKSPKHQKLLTLNKEEDGGPVETTGVLSLSGGRIKGQDTHPCGPTVVIAAEAKHVLTSTSHPHKEKCEFWQAGAVLCCWLPDINCFEGFDESLFLVVLVALVSGVRWGRSMIRQLEGLVAPVLNLLIRLEEWQSGSQLDLIPWNQSGLFGP